MIKSLKCLGLLLFIIFLYINCDLFKNDDISGTWNYSFSETYCELITSSDQTAINPASEINGSINVTGEFNLKLTYINIEELGPSTEISISNSSSKVPTKFPFIEYSLYFDDGELMNHQLLIMTSMNSFTYYVPVSINISYNEELKSIENIESVFWKYDYFTGVLDSNTVTYLSGSTQFQTIEIKANTPKTIERDNFGESISEFILELNNNGKYHYQIQFLNSSLSDTSDGKWETVDNYLILLSEDLDTTKLKYDLDDDKLELRYIEYCEELEGNKQNDCFEEMEDFYHIDSGSLISCKKVNEQHFKRK
jgi:hypothetical protein